MNFLTKLAGSVTLLCALGCGPTVGDACTTSHDCGDQLCVTRDFAPGGYCSKTCTLGDDSTCPFGSTCIKGVVGDPTPAPGCMKICKTVNDCRTGYTCQQPHEGDKLVCQGAGVGI